MAAWFVKRSRMFLVMSVVETVKRLYLRVITKESGRLWFWVGVLLTSKMCIVMGEGVIYTEQYKP
jgi:hypothetical protein